jgi:hypothetical protein
MKIVKNYHLAFMLVFPLFLWAEEGVTDLSINAPNSELLDLFDQLEEATDAKKSQSNPQYAHNKDKIQRLQQQAQHLQNDYFAQLKKLSDNYIQAKNSLEADYLKNLQTLYAQIQDLMK